MRMRVTKPDFWESEEISNLSHFGRLLLKAIWSYADDNGVQKDSAVGIAAECFRYDLARDPTHTLKLIEAGMDELWAAARITRYAVDGIRYIEATDWDFWQKPQKPSKPRYPKSDDPRAEIFMPDACSTDWLQSSGSVSGSVSAQDYPTRHSGDSPETLWRCLSCGGPGPLNTGTRLCLSCSRSRGEV
jgi:hypothetical protein